MDAASKSLIRRLLLVCFLAVWFGCAGGTIAQIGNDGKLPSELSKDLQEKYEIKDAGMAKPVLTPATSSPVVLPVSETTDSSKTVSKKKSKVVAAGLSPSLAPKPYVIPNRRPKNDPIWIGEKFVYDVSYFGVGAAEVTLETLPYKSINNRKVYHARGLAVTSSIFSLFYRVKDSVETFFDYEGLFSYRFHLLLDETKQNRDSLELNDSEKAQTFFWNRWNHKVRGYSEIKEFAPITPFSQDTLSALYFLRTVPLPNGAVFSVPIVSERKNWEAEVTVLRREVIDSPMGPVQAVVLKPATKYAGVLKQQGDSFMWLTDDDRRVLIRMEAKVRIGTVVANLKKFEPGTPHERVEESSVKTDLKSPAEK